MEKGLGSPAVPLHCALAAGHCFGAERAEAQIQKHPFLSHALNFLLFL